MTIGSLFNRDPLAPRSGGKGPAALAKSAYPDRDTPFGSTYTRAFADDRRQKRRSPSPFAFGPNDEEWRTFDYAAAQAAEPDVAHPIEDADRLRFDWQRQAHRTPANATIARSIGLRQKNDRTDVAKLETALHDLGAFDLFKTAGPTGYFGFLTDEAIRDFQDVAGLKVDGTVTPGGETWRTLTGLQQAIGRHTKPMPGSYRTMELRPEEVGRGRIRTMEYRPDRDGVPQHRKLGAKPTPAEDDGQPEETQEVPQNGRIWRNILNASANGAAAPKSGSPSRATEGAGIPDGENKDERPYATTRIADWAVGIIDPDGTGLTSELWRHFREESGKEIVLDAERVRDLPTITDRTDKNNLRFIEDFANTGQREETGTDTFGQQLSGIEDGQTIDLTDNWKAAFAGHDHGIGSDAHLSIGGGTVVSEAEAKATRHGNTIEIAGKVYHALEDRYDFAPDEDPGAIGALTGYLGDGTEFDVRSTPWTSTISGTATIEDGVVKWQRLEIAPDYPHIDQPRK